MTNCNVVQIGLLCEKHEVCGDKGYSRLQLAASALTLTSRFLYTFHRLKTAIQLFFFHKVVLNPIYIAHKTELVF